MIVGALWFVVLKNRMPQVLLGIEHDLESATVTTGKNPREVTA
jgi:hypothetical protein